MRPCELSTHRVDNLFILKGFCKIQTVPKVFSAPTIAVFLGKN